METEVLQPEAIIDQEHAARVINIPGVVRTHKKWIIRTTAIASLMSLAVALLWPARYAATTKILPPQQSQSMAAAVISQMSALGSLGGIAQGTLGVRNPNDLYIGMLKSRTIEDALVLRFELQRVYGEKRMSDVRKDLEKNSEILNGKEGFISISVEDRDPKRAAALANGYVDQLKQLTRTFAVTEAGQRRLFFDQQLEEAKKDLADSEEALKQTQQATGLIQLDSQAKAIIESVVRLRSEITAREVQLRAMRSFATESNPDVQLAEKQLEALRAQMVVTNKLGGGDGDLQVATGKLPQAGLEYVRRLREFKYREAMFELLAKQSEAARLDEAKAGGIIQVLDVAVEPDKKNSPKRGVIFIGLSLLSFLGAVSFQIGREIHRLSRSMNIVMPPQDAPFSNKNS